MPFHRLILIVFILLMSALLQACGTGSSLRVSQITPRAEATQCVALAPIARDEWIAPAADPNLSTLLTAAGVVGEDHIAVIERAAGAYARQVQIEEQAFTARRDVSQTSVNREMCNRQHELVGLIQANNAGPE